MAGCPQVSKIPTFSVSQSCFFAESGNVKNSSLLHPRNVGNETLDNFQNDLKIVKPYLGAGNETMRIG